MVGRLKSHDRNTDDAADELPKRGNPDIIIHRTGAHISIKNLQMLEPAIVVEKLFELSAKIGLDTK